MDHFQSKCGCFYKSADKTFLHDLVRLMDLNMYEIHKAFPFPISYLQECMFPCTSKHNHCHHKWKLALLSLIVMPCCYFFYKACCTSSFIWKHIPSKRLPTGFGLLRDPMYYLFKIFKIRLKVNIMHVWWHVVWWYGCHWRNKLNFFLTIFMGLIAPNFIFILTIGTEFFVR